MGTPDPTRFDRDTAALRRPDADDTADAAYDVNIAEHWNVVVGPNGGFLAALLARAMTEEVADPERLLRSITVHFLRRPDFGPAMTAVRILRTGRSLSTVSATLHQDGTPIATALAAFSVPWDENLSWNLPLPDRAHGPSGSPGWAPPPHVANYDVDLVLPAPLVDGSDEARVGGWIRTADPRVVDPVVLVAMADALPPAVFTRTLSPMAVPTVDLTVHIRSNLPLQSLGADERLYAEFTTDHVAEGFLEESGAIWAPDGTLMAQSHQLAIAR